MPDFDARKEAKSIDTILEYSEHAASSDSGNLTSSRLLEDAQNQFCKLSPVDQDLTIKAMEDNSDYSSSMQVVRGGYDQPVGVIHQTEHNGLMSRSFLSLTCPFETTNKK